MYFQATEICILWPIKHELSRHTLFSMWGTAKSLLHLSASFPSFRIKTSSLQAGQVKKWQHPCQCFCITCGSLPTADTLVNWHFVKHSLNYSNLNKPSASYWVPDRQNKIKSQSGMWGKAHLPHLLIYAKCITSGRNQSHILNHSDPRVARWSSITLTYSDKCISTHTYQLF